MKRHSYILFFFCFAHFFVFSQDKGKTDSLVKLLSTSIPDSTRVNALNEIAWKVLDFPDRSFKYVSKALALAQEIDFERGMAKSYSRMGEVYNAKGNYNLALKNLRESYRIYEKLGSKKLMNVVMNSIGNTYLGNSDNVKALEAFRKCYQIGVEMNDSNFNSSFFIWNW